MSPIEKAIAHYGSLAAMARAVGVKRYQVIQQWRDAGVVPPEYCPQIEQDTGISRIELCPKRGERIWPECAQAAQHEEGI